MELFYIIGKVWLDLVRFRWISSDSVGFRQNRLDLVGFRRIQLGSVGSGQITSDFVVVG